MTNFELTWEREGQGDKFYYLSLNSDTAPSVQFNPATLLSSNWVSWYIGREVYFSAML